MENLKSLFLSSNPIKKIPESIISNDKMKYTSLSQEELDESSKEIIESLEKKEGLLLFD
ncbi:hypothetical protein [Candidatus Lokiarchaeum ossiferum]|uniref:hypothetical protein n=1 Tax=Candidatus Lokiarchaeum ossiferum TaxID=2951803 RepID=UPI00352FDAED